ncbi:MAG: tetratricopeptide repeat protein, partial [Methanoregula sp.]
LDPQNMVTWNSMGLIYLDQENYERALAAFDQATRITIKNATVWNNKGKAYVGLGKPADALQCFNKALGIDPGFADAQKNKEGVTGQLQTYNVSETPTTTMTINKLGTYYTTATPVPAGTPASEPEEIATGHTTAAPVSKKTTYAPLSPFTAVGALLALVALTGIACRNRK